MSTMGDRVSLNVGGHTFETSMTTMTKDPHSLLAKIAHHDLSTSRSAFIDRDGTHFRYILNFLRDGSCVIPSTEQHQQELRIEAEYFQVQGLLELMSASRESDSVASRPINASLIPFKREAQEANLIGRLRQKAGPAVIDCVVRTLIEATYASTLLPTGSKYRNVNLVDLVTAVDYKPTQRLYTFVEAYIHVIKHDLGKLGYTLSLVPHGLKYYSGQNYQSVVLGACNSGSTSTTLESLVTGSSWGPALRVSDNS